MDKLTCLRCGYEWYRRSIEPPKCCPKCKSRLWDKAPNKVIIYKDGAGFNEINKNSLVAT